MTVTLPEEAVEKSCNKILAQIFYTDRDEEVAKPNKTSQAKMLTQDCVSTHCSSQNQNLTQYSSDVPASTVDQYAISGSTYQH